MLRVFAVIFMHETNSEGSSMMDGWMFLTERRQAPARIHEMGKSLMFKNLLSNGHDESVGFVNHMIRQSLFDREGKFSGWLSR